MSKIESVLDKQLKIADTLLLRVTAIPDGEKSPILSGYIRYDESITRPLEKDVEAWQTETTEFLRVLFGDNARQVKEFERCINDKSHYFKFREGIQSEIQDCISKLKAFIKAEGMKQDMAVNVSSPSSYIVNTPKVFISHSSADTDIILSFIQNVLVLGLGLDKGDIVFTSDETYGINPGGDIPQYIKRTISGARVVLIMVSQGYKKSEVCLNEMGAAWALEKNIISVLLPDANFDQLGWVINLKKAVRLDKKKSLLSLTNQIAKLISVDMTDRFTDAVTGIDDFLDSINKADTPKNTDYQITASSNVSVNAQPPISYNGESPERVLNDAINKLGEFTIKQLQDETGFKDYHYIAENVHSMVLSGALEEIGSKSHRKYRQVVTSHPLF